MDRSIIAVGVDKVEKSSVALRVLMSFATSASSLISSRATLKRLKKTTIGCALFATKKFLKIIAQLTGLYATL